MIFILNLIELQGIKINYSHVNNVIFEVFATSEFEFAKCPNCGNITYKIHDKRSQSYNHLPIWGMNTVLILEIKRYVCNCEPKNPFDEYFSFIRRYQRYNIPYEQYIFKLDYKNTIKDISAITGAGEGTKVHVRGFTTIMQRKPLIYVPLNH